MRNIRRTVAAIALLALAFSGATTAFAQEAAGNPLSAYGVCAHLSGDDLAPAKLHGMREIGIGWTRADLRWGTVERGDGDYRFGEFDQLVERCGQSGVILLPILSQQDDKKPTSDYLAAWENYVRATVTRYKDRLGYWEVINEPNLDMMWGPELPGGEYAKLMQTAYRIIKKIDPNLTVVHGGLAGTPCAYLNAEFDAVQGEFFDIMNIHCYRGGMRTIESIKWYENDIRKIAALMKEHGADKPLWITETGWSSLPNFGEIYNLIVSFGLTAAFGPDAKPVCGYLRDERYLPSLFYEEGSLMRMFPKGSDTRAISLDDLSGITPSKCAALLLPPGEAFPSPYFDDLVEYVRLGGVLFQLGGLPFRYEVEKNADGHFEAKTTAASGTYREKFCLDTLTHETDMSVPAIAVNRVPAPILPMLDAKTRALLDGFGDTYQSTRFLSPRLFDTADQATVFLVAQEGEFSAPTAVMIRPKGFKGAIIASTVNELETTNIATEEDQALYLPQNILIARCAGAQKVFWYEYQSTENNPIDKESFFGLTRADLSPKPAYHAYRALIAACPDGSTGLTRRFFGDSVIVDWTRPDQNRCYALWSPAGERTIEVQIDGKVVSASDCLGNPVAIDSNAKILTLSPKIVYVTTSKELQFKNPPSDAAIRPTADAVR